MFKERFNNLKNFRKDWKVIQQNPYLHQKFMFTAYKYLIIFLGFLLILNIGRVIYGVLSSSRNNLTATLTGGFMILVGVIIILKLYNIINQLKINLEHYEKSPQQVVYDENKPSVKEEVDEILDKYDVKGGVK